jgi:hypothetical protein
MDATCLKLVGRDAAERDVDSISEICSLKMPRRQTDECRSEAEADSGPLMSSRQPRTMLLR